MKQDPYKKEVLKKWLIPRVVGTIIIFMIILIVVIMSSMYESTQIYNEGVAKSIPLLSNEKMKKLGDLYIKKQQEFEQEIMNMEINYANRTNKRGDKIFYGVNGRENPDEVVNNDYVNGIESIKYVKGKSEDRLDGDSNFVDMISFLSVALGSDIDRYSDEELLIIFDKLFNITHTFTGTSTELYPCDSGCSWCKYYCGDIRVQGTVGGDTVGFYRCDEYMGESGKFGLMYDPFLATKRPNYQELKDLAGNETKMKTTYQYKDVKITFFYSVDGVSENHTIVTKGDTVVSEDDEIFLLNEPEGYCPVCSGRRQTFSSTTRTFGGCITHVECHCSSAVSKHLYRGKDDETGYWVDWHMGENKGQCENYEALYECDWEPPENSDGDVEHECANPEIGCDGYYRCLGHNHYACPGHIIVCCFGHTNLNLEIKILYYEDMIDTIKDLLG